MSFIKRSLAQRQHHDARRASPNFARRVRLARDEHGGRRAVVDTNQGTLELDQLPGQLALPPMEEEPVARHQEHSQQPGHPEPRAAIAGQGDAGPARQALPRVPGRARQPDGQPGVDAWIVEAVDSCFTYAARFGVPEEVTSKILIHWGEQLARHNVHFAIPEPEATEPSRPAPSLSEARPARRRSRRQRPRAGVCPPSARFAGVICRQSKREQRHQRRSTWPLYCGIKFKELVNALNVSSKQRQGRCPDGLV